RGRQEFIFTWYKNTKEKRNLSFSQSSAVRDGTRTMDFNNKQQESNNWAGKL
ncbi:unnamed protein product, partial [marine sediment metagenome]